MTTTTAPKFRKTQSGKWAVFGPASVVRPGTVRVVKADGTTKTVTIASVGKTFTVDGVSCVYGYEAERTSRPANKRSGRTFRCSHCGEQRTQDYCPGFDCDGDF